MQLTQEVKLVTLESSDADKVGMVFVDGLDSDDPKILLTRVNPKNPGEMPDMALPRGTRDVKDPATGLFYDPRERRKAGIDTTAWPKESLYPALIREAHEEVGVTEHALAQAPLHDMGIQPFSSRKGEQFTVHWFGSSIQCDALEEMKERATDATHLQWASLSTIDQMAAQGKMNPCYAQAAHQAVDGMRTNAFNQYVLPTTEAQRTR